MIRSQSIRFAIAACLFHAASKVILADQIDGPLDVTGDVDIRGAVLSLGSRYGDPEQPGVSWIFTDSEAGPSAMHWQASRPLHEWLWTHASDAGGDRMALKLDATHRLLFYPNLSGSPEPSITLDPSGVSSFAHSLQLSGTTNLMPHQTLDGGADSVLNLGLADARYYRIGTLSFGSGNTVTGTGASAMGLNNVASGPFAFAAGVSTRATGVGSVALGLYSQATGQHASALGQSLASGQYASALGNSGAAGTNASALGQSGANGRSASALGSSHANGEAASAMGQSWANGPSASAIGLSDADGQFSFAAGNSIAHANGGVAFGASGAYGPYSTALGMSYTYGAYSLSVGINNETYGDGSVALGQWNTAYGTGAMAFGIGNYAQGFSQIVLGQYNLPQGDPYNWLPEDALFIIGNGSMQTFSTGTPVYVESWDDEGNLNWVQLYDAFGNPVYQTYQEPVRSNAFAVSKNGDTSAAGSVSAGGHVAANGDVIAEGKGRFRQGALVAPQGDISMGAFTAGPQP